MNIYYIQSAETHRIVADIARNFSKHTFVALPHIDDVRARGRIAPLEDRAVLLWGNGDEHDVSYHFRPDRLYSKVVYDAHADFQVVNCTITCGNHNTALIRDDPRLHDIHVLGVAVRNQRGMWSTRGRYTGSIYVEDKLFPLPRDQAVHLSLDMDVVYLFGCDPIYAQGLVPYDHIRAGVQKVVKTNNVVRFDIGGLCLDRQEHVISRSIGQIEELLALYLAAA